jgi:hypothetical protein
MDGGAAASFRSEEPDEAETLCLVSPREAGTGAGIDDTRVA